MVLELIHICLRSIRDGIEQGRIDGAHLSLIPPNHLRQHVLDWILLNGTINNPNCMAALSSVEFLDGVESLHMLKSRGADKEYLTRLANTLRAVSVHGGTIGSKITNLRLNSINNDRYQNHCVARVIRECPNLKALSWRTIFFEASDDTLISPDSFCQQLIAPEMHSCRQIVAGVNELSIMSGGNVDFQLDNAFLATPFTNLCSLHIWSRVVEGDGWLALMESAKKTLKTLHVNNLRINAMGDLLPHPMPLLEDLQIFTSLGAPRFHLSMDILRQCPTLNHLCLPFTEYTGQAAVVALDSLSNVRIDIKLYLSGLRDDMDLLLNEPPPRNISFSLVTALNEKITSVTFTFVNWEPKYAVAFEHFVGDCPHLTDFEFLARSVCNQVDLSPLFSNAERAGQLRHIGLSGNISFGNLFHSCLSLESLHLANNQRVYGTVLIQLDQQGVRLSRLEIECCRNIDQYGLMVILVASGPKLSELRLKGFGNVYDRIQHSLKHYCPLLETVKLE